MKEIMTCGHAANGTKEPDGEPVCVICDCATVSPRPNLAGRTARCSYFGSMVRGRKCTGERPSTESGLAFFAHRPDHEYDDYYCGCYGWD